MLAQLLTILLGSCMIPIYGVKVACVCQTIMRQGVVVFFYQAFMSILATWLAIWFSAELAYSAPLCVRSLATS